MPISFAGLSGGGGATPKVVEFTSTGSWTAPDDVSAIEIFLVGGGGANGFVNQPTTFRRGAGGGGQVLKQMINVTPGQSYSVVVGAGGSNGSKGGDTYISNLATAYGGGCGVYYGTQYFERYYFGPIADPTAGTFSYGTVGAGGGEGGDLSGYRAGGAGGGAGGPAGDFAGKASLSNTGVSQPKNSNNYFGYSGNSMATVAAESLGFGRGGTGIDGFGGGGGGYVYSNSYRTGAQVQGHDGGGAGEYGYTTSLPLKVLEKSNGRQNTGGGAGLAYGTNTRSGGSGYAKIIYWTGS